MSKFVLHWHGGKRTDTVEGDDIAQAFTRHGYGAGALRALDFYHEEGRPITVLGRITCGCTAATTTNTQGAAS